MHHVRAAEQANHEPDDRGQNHACRIAHREPADDDASDDRRALGHLAVAALAGAIHHCSGDESDSARHHDAGQVGIAEVAEDHRAQRDERGESGRGAPVRVALQDHVARRDKNQDQQEAVARESEPGAEDARESVHRSDYAEAGPVVALEDRAIGDIAAEERKAGIELAVEQGACPALRDQAGEEADRQHEDHIAPVDA
jgi:hypothetical protein